MVLMEPCSSEISAEGIAAIVSNRILRLGWRPRRLVTDSEMKMTGVVMQSLAHSLGAVVAPSPPHHQQANAVERSIQTVQVTLRVMCLESKVAWDRRAVPSVELAMNSTPSVSTGARPFDLVFIAHPRIVHAVFDVAEHDGVGSFQERLAAAEERLTEAREILAAARAEQKRRYDAKRRSLPELAVGDKVFVRLTDRPVPGAITSKLDVRKLGPFRVAEVLSSHRVRLALPDPLRIHDIFSVEQLDVVPADVDPFATTRDVPPPLASSSVEDADEAVSVVSATEHDEDDEHPPAVRPSRATRPPINLREYDMGLYAASVDTELLRTPSSKPRRVMVEGREIVLLERPVAYLSRLTTTVESKLVASELELCCFAWAMGRLMHLLEGALVTVVTDHAPLGPMLTATASHEYGPTISKCRAMLMPHIPNLRFIYKPGRKHTNADALSRLVSTEVADADDPGRSSSVGGDVLDEA
ncbi:hypothetical protein CF328_g8134 [Tilletia controversa]|nr:hypothetical protein CF328_g8134 [Tilletia controversa]